MILENIDLEQYDIDLTLEDFKDEMADDFNDYFRGQESIHELVRAPRQAHQFCDWVRTKRGYLDVPDDIILQCVLDRDEVSVEEIAMEIPCLGIQVTHSMLTQLGLSFA
ncbi:hypothetical protein [Lacipirellula sp.]|uniref:hypothetical protein n=1 Tax=Lacipirellula sp. TaxID=2691419 RepID=UPI003D0B6C21